MNNITSTLISRNWQRPFSLKQLNRKEPCEAVLYENRRLELIQSMPLQRVKVRRQS